MNKISVAVLLYAALSLPAYAKDHHATAPVSGFAISFLSSKGIPDAKITIQETGQIITTDKDGHFGPFNYPVGKSVTLLLEKSGFKTTQSATVTIPKEGLTTPYNNITFQVPSTMVFTFLSKVVGGKEDPESCHVASTIIKYHKTLHDVPQGEPGAIVSVEPAANETPFYFDIFEKGPLKGYTYPFATGLKTTSEDGGIAFFNLPPRNEPYKLTAKKNGVVFSEAKFICRKGMFVNVSPPNGPMAQK